MKQNVSTQIVLALAILLSWSPGFAAQVGEPAPTFSLPALASNMENVALGDFKDRVIYLDFWASWCAPCRQSLPLLNAMRGDFERDDFEVVAINLDTDPALGRRFLKHYPVDYPVASDPQGKVAASYQLPNMPTAYIIDRTGKIAQVHNGFRPSDMPGIRSEVTTLIGGGRPHED